MAMIEFHDFFHVFLVIGTDAHGIVESGIRAFLQNHHTHGHQNANRQKKYGYQYRFFEGNPAELHQHEQGKSGNGNDCQPAKVMPQKHFHQQVAQRDSGSDHGYFGEGIISLMSRQQVKQDMN